MTDKQMDELVALREQMTVPDLDEVEQTSVRIDGVDWTVVWAMHPRWGIPEVLAIYHGVMNLLDYIERNDIPHWATKAMNADAAAMAREAQELPYEVDA